MTEEKKCIFCGITDGSMQSAKIYEDDLVVCVLDIFPASKGHVLVIPKKHIAISAQLDEALSAHLFNVGNKMSAILFEAMEAEGTNLLIANGAAAGQKVDHLVLHVIPRYKDDGVNITWNSEQIKEDELKYTFEKITSMTQGAKAPTEEKPKEEPVKDVPLEEVVEDLEEETFDEEERIP
ncbi:HIT family protein [Candidatus Woesearchaeota archaeon]|jgi:histidine triad (HIT) family protein|nr:HIT family protein [Candidatus Woesearchaeota archaeon]MBT6044566.1 HIT family protein [Candidatus Woesearchaeota archaeon]